jgi:hypothetical protein
MRFFIHSCFALAGLWGFVAVGSAIDPALIPQTAGVVHILMKASVGLH